MLSICEIRKQIQKKIYFKLLLKIILFYKVILSTLFLIIVFFSILNKENGKKQLPTVDVEYLI